MSDSPKPINTILLFVTIGLLGWIAVTVQGQSVSSAEMRGEIKAMNERLEASTKNRWSAAHQKIWASDLHLRNPSLSIPDPSDVVRDYQN